MDALVSHEAVFRTDAGGTVRDWSPEAERLTGIAAAEANGRLCWELIGGCDAAGRVVCRSACSTPCASSTLRTSLAQGEFDLSTIVVGTNGDVLILHTLRPADVQLRAAVPRARDTHLTPRQREVLHLLADGLRVAQIAARLTLSEATVRNHVRAILLELDAHSQLEAVARARALGLLPDAS